MNRLTRISFPDSTQDVVFSYDQGVNGKGRLTAMTDPSGTYTYTYDVFGNLVTETRITGGITFTTQYAYAQGGPLQSITYPSGRIVTYERDAAGRVIRVKDTMGGTTRTLADNVSHLPFGPMKGLTYGNGMAETRGFDQMYRLTGLNAGNVMNLSYTHDPVGNILTISNLTTPPEARLSPMTICKDSSAHKEFTAQKATPTTRSGTDCRRRRTGRRRITAIFPGRTRSRRSRGINPLLLFL